MSIEKRLTALEQRVEVLEGHHSALMVSMQGVFLSLRNYAPAAHKYLHAKLLECEERHRRQNSHSDFLERLREFRQLLESPGDSRHESP